MNKNKKSVAINTSKGGIGEKPTGKRPPAPMAQSKQNTNK